MKYKYFLIKIYIAVVVSVIFLAFSSCKKSAEDTKKVAEERNDDKFEKTQEADAAVLVEVAEFNLQQAHLGNLTAIKSTNAEVRSFGKMMEDTHGNYLEGLSEMAESKQISIPTSLTEDNKKNYNALNRQDIEDFDNEYLERIIENHQEAIENYMKQSEKTSDSDIKIWLTAQLATLREHLDSAKILQSRLNRT